MIKNKIRAVPDSVCEKCTQLWEDECRAWEMPHSEEERLSRKVELPYKFPCEGHVPPKSLDRIDYWTIVAMLATLGLILVLVYYCG